MNAILALACHTMISPFSRLQIVSILASAELPRGGRVRRSKSMAADQVAALLALELTPFWRAWIVTAVQTGLRPGEMIGLRWADVDNSAGVIRVRQALKRSAEGMVPAGLKTESSRRTLALPAMTAAVLERQRRAQAAERLKAAAWTDMDLVFAGPAGRGRWLQYVNRELKLLCKQAGMGTDWQLRETRHTFVSVLSDAGVDIDRIADAVGHVNSTITRQVYRHMISDKVTETASVMDRLFPQDGAR
jgi:integrase